MTTASTKLRPEELMRSVVLLTPSELSEFVLRFDEWRLKQPPQADAKAAQIADAHRLPVRHRVRVAELLSKNREKGLTIEEESELDTYLSDLDQRLIDVSSRLIQLADSESQSAQRARP